jgi:predicted O-methyltransferase YrrM
MPFSDHMGYFFYRTRRLFFTQNGAFVGRNLPHAAVALVQAVRRKTFKSYPELPWIAFSAIRTLSQLARRDWIVREIGAGMSTIWLSERVRHVTSIEADQGWYTKLRDILNQRGISNVDLRYEWHAHIMSDFTDVPESSLDLLFIDGGPREQCLFNGFVKVRSGGYIYLDNTDFSNFWPGLNKYLLEKRIEIRRVTEFVDYSPAHVEVSEGLLIEKC